MKYQPYKGYQHKPWLSYGEPGYPWRIKTQHDWQWRNLPRYHQADCARFSTGDPLEQFCRRCGKAHCHICGCWQPWKKYDKDSAAANFEKRLVHRAFRREARAAISRELLGDDAVSHGFFISGNWLD